MYELLDVHDDTTVLAHWNSRFLAGEACMISRAVGAGRALYVASYITNELINLAIAQELTKAGVAPLIANLPEHVEVTLRKSAERELLFVLNTSESEVLVDGVPAGVNLLNAHERVGKQLILGGYACTIIELE